MAKDSVCRIDVDEENAVGTLVYRDRTYYFCTEAWKQAIQKDPQKYTD